MDTPETATVEITQADRKRLAAYYCHPLVNNPSMAEAVLADDWLSGASDAEIAMLETLARHRTTRQDGLREADIALLGARMVLEGKATNATGALAKSDWKPSRAHIEGMRNTMREAIEYIDEALAAPSDSSTREESGAGANPLANKTGRFAAYSTGSLSGQCRMQARDNLDPEYSQFMLAVSDRLDALREAAIRAREAIRIERDHLLDCCTLRGARETLDEGAKPDVERMDAAIDAIDAALSASPEGEGAAFEPCHYCDRAVRRETYRGSASIPSTEGSKS